MNPFEWNQTSILTTSKALTTDKPDTNSSYIIERAKRVLSIEAEQLTLLSKKIDEKFVQIVNVIQACEGKLIVSGMGKSGLIGKKIASTLSSYGVQSFFLHPAEANHGDLGMAGTSDVILFVSYSGETDEILKLIPFFQRHGNKIIAMTGNIHSTLARYADYSLDVGIDKEACPLELAPTSSTTATLAMGDALAVALMESNGVKAEEFALLHPGGSLGRKLLVNVEDEMIRVEELPMVPPDANAIDTIHTISDGRLGIAIVADGEKKLLGIITDGDIRRSTLREKENFLQLTAAEMMTRNPQVVQPDTRIFDAETLMDSLGIHQLVVVSTHNKVVGILPYRNQIKR